MTALNHSYFTESYDKSVFACVHTAYRMQMHVMSTIQCLQHRRYLYRNLPAYSQFPNFPQRGSWAISFVNKDSRLPMLLVWSFLHCSRMGCRCSKYNHTSTLLVVLVVQDDITRIGVYKTHDFVRKS